MQAIPTTTWFPRDAEWQIGGVAALEGAWAGPPADDQASDEFGAAATAAGADLELTDLERALNYGAVAGLLHEIFLSSAPYAPLVAEDMKRCTERHFKGMGALLRKCTHATLTTTRSPWMV